MNKIVNGVANDYEFPQIDYTHHDSRTDEPLQKQIQTFTRWEDPTIKDLQQELEKYKNIVDELKKCIDYYATEEEDYSKIYSTEEIELLNILNKLNELKGESFENKIVR